MGRGTIIWPIERAVILESTLALGITTSHRKRSGTWLRTTRIQGAETVNNDQKDLKSDPSNVWLTVMTFQFGKEKIEFFRENPDRAAQMRDYQTRSSPFTPSTDLVPT
jgi:hypothetical protein